MPKEQWCKMMVGMSVRRFVPTALEISAIAKVAIAVQVAIGRLSLVPSVTAWL